MKENVEIMSCPHPKYHATLIAQVHTEKFSLEAVAKGKTTSSFIFKKTYAHFLN